jgi:hypothetical protein
MSEYIVEIEQDLEIARFAWFWWVQTPLGGPPMWSANGCTFTRWGAKRQALRAIKRAEAPTKRETFTVGGEA